MLQPIKKTTILFFMGCMALFISCAPKEKDLQPVDKVIGSMSDSVPILTMPDDVDLEHEDWKGADLGAKSPVLPLYPEEEAKNLFYQRVIKLLQFLRNLKLSSQGRLLLMVMVGCLF